MVSQEAVQKMYASQTVKDLTGSNQQVDLNTETYQFQFSFIIAKGQWPTGHYK